MCYSFCKIKSKISMHSGLYTMCTLLSSMVNTWFSIQENFWISKGHQWFCRNKVSNIVTHKMFYFFINNIASSPNPLCMLDSEFMKTIFFKFNFCDAILNLCQQPYYRNCWYVHALKATNEQAY